MVPAAHINVVVESWLGKHRILGLPKREQVLDAAIGSFLVAVLQSLLVKPWLLEGLIKVGRVGSLVVKGGRVLIGFFVLLIAVARLRDSFHCLYQSLGISTELLVIGKAGNARFQARN